MNGKIRKTVALGTTSLLLASGFTIAGLPAMADPGLSSVTLVGDLQKAIGCESDWMPACEASQLEPVVGLDGVYQSTFDIPAGTFEYKVAFDGGWDESYPSDNRTVRIDGPTEIKFTYMTKTDERAERLALTPTLTGEYTAEDDALVQQPVRQPGAGKNFYFVLVDRFNDGDPSNNYGDATTPEEGGYNPSNTGYYFGGDIKGLEEKLDYIQGLGTSAIWLAPMFKNKAVQGEGADASAGYHGYWVTDFTQIDPHFGTNEEMKQFIDAAHAKGMEVYFDIITNHTADVIYYEEGEYSYKDINEYPYYDAAGNVVDVTQLAKDRAPFPEFDPLTSFPYTPVTTAAEADIKVPAWLNDVTLYHNRGDTTWEGQSVTFGDFGGLDDLMTEHPTVVNGFVDVYKTWVDFGIDGFRIDTVKHVNFEFWEDWTTPIANYASDDFFMFGEVYSADQSITSDYVRMTDMDSILDFAFQASAVSYATGSSARTLASQFANDAYFVTPNRSPNALPTFLGNHDMGRVGAMVARVDNSLKRDELAHELMYLTRGQPVVYYGDEQGLTGAGDGTDKHSRQPLFGDKGGAYSGQHTLDGQAVDGNPLFNTDSTMYKTISKLANLRDSHAALKDGAQIERYVEDGPGIYAFSRVDATEKVEYLVAVNNATTAQSVEIPALTRSASFAPVYGTEASVTSDAEGKMTIEVPAMSSIVLKADKQVYSPDDAFPVKASLPYPGAAVSGQTKVTATIDSDVWQQTSFSWRVVGSDTWTPLGVSEAGAPAVYQDLAALPTGTLIEYRAVTTDAAGNHAASSTYGSVGIAVGEEDDPGAEFEIYMVNIPGTHQKDMGCADNWQPACEASKLLLIENGLYKQSFTLPSGNYEYKVALNGSWDVNYGADGVFDGSNVKYDFAGGDIDFYWDPVSKKFTNTALGKVAVVAGDFQSQLGCEGANGGNWQPWCFGSLATNLGDGTYEFSTDQVAAGTYEAKAAFSTGWDDTIGNEEGENIKFTLSEDGATLKFVIDTNNSSMCVYQNGEELYCPGGTPPVKPDEATLALSTSSVEVGGKVTATGTGFEANEQVDFVLASADGATDTALGNAYADEDGNVTLDFTVDESTDPGDYVVQARGSDSDRTAEADLTVTAAGEKPEPSEPTLTLSTSSVEVGGKVTATGTGFEAGEVVDFALGTAVEKRSETATTLGNAKANESGEVTLNFTIADSVEPGDYLVLATGNSSDRTANAALKVTPAAEKPGPSDKAKLTLSKTQVSPGSKLTATAEGFQANETVAFYLDGSGKQQKLTTAVVGADGKATATLEIADSVALGKYIVRAEGQTSDRVAEAELQVVKLAVTGAQIGLLASLGVVLVGGGVAIAASNSRRKASAPQS